MGTINSVRPATADDLLACAGIYNHYVEHTVATFDTQPMSDAAATRWYRSHQKTLHPLLVAEVGNDIVGYGSLSRWSTKDAYGRTSEVSVFVSAEHHRKGAGSALLDGLLGVAREVGHRCLIARIEADNRPSINLFRSRGFTTVGVMHDAGFKFGRWLNVKLMERLVDHTPAAEGGV